MERISFLMKTEKLPLTRNYHYYADSRSKFLSYYKGLLDPRKNNNFLQKLQDMRLDVTGKASIQEPLNRILSGFVEIGFGKVEAVSLIRLQDPDPMDEAIEIMADVRAYFQGMRDIISGRFLHLDSDAPLQSRISASLIQFPWPSIRP